MKMMFRLLKANEIDCRISTINEKGLTLLLYKDARCDMNILDETVGPYNWKREHARENANCIVSIYDPEKKEWVSKEDTGTESCTEKEKGLASDSFKRACFNWGIGRELYTAPFIWINAADAKIIKGANGKYRCYDKFTVENIEYDDENRISSITIINSKSNRVVFGGNKEDKESTEPAEPVKPTVTPVMVSTINAELERTGGTLAQLLAMCKIKDIKDMTVAQYKQIMTKFENTPDKQHRMEEYMNIPEGADEEAGLPFK